MKKILYTANFLMVAALGVHACEKNPESPKNPFKSFINACATKFKAFKNKPKPLVIIIPTKPQSFTQQEVGKSNALNTNTSEPQFEMFTDMPEEIIQGQIMSVLDDPGFLRFALSCKLLWNLAKTGFNQRFEQNKQEQREIFKKKVVKNHKQLDLRNMNLKTIYPGVFDSPEFKKIQLIGLCDYNLKKLGKGTFEGLPDLQYLYLNDNRLADLHKDIFQDLKKLKNLSLHGNELTQQSINSEIFKGLKNLEDLDLSFNKLTELHNDTFNNLVHLQILTLSGNKITHLDKNILRNLTFLRTLALTGNRLTHKNINELKQFKKRQKEQSKILNELQTDQSTSLTNHSKHIQDLDTSFSIDEMYRHLIEIKAQPHSGINPDISSSEDDF